ncbi:hypothetical protein BJF85_02525 [Saccharomonospora sp. CUA-673]|nr:hypothetical protein BJF85_02525 [Saccharomonospora sp. CUA-673]
MLDGQENPLKVADANSFFEKQEYLSLTSHIYSPVYLAMNDQAWQDLPQDLQEGLQEAADAASATSRELAAEADRTLIEKFEAEGMTVNEADVDALREAVADVRDEIADDIPGDFADRVLTSVEP